VSLKLEPGTVHKHYELIRQLGAGGMGVVFLARDIRLGRLVAIKFLLDRTGTAAPRFLGEARATALCRHENIVIIHDVDEVDGSPYIVLEYIRRSSSSGSPSLASGFGYVEIAHSIRTSIIDSSLALSPSRTPPITSGRASGASDAPASSSPPTPSPCSTRPPSVASATSTGSPPPPSAQPLEKSESSRARCPQQDPATRGRRRRPCPASTLPMVLDVRQAFDGTVADLTCNPYRFQVASLKVT
jgi:hypothetical protein